MSIDKEKYIAKHYASENLLERIKAALVARGENPEALDAEDLKGVDEFHTGELCADTLVPKTHLENKRTREFYEERGFMAVSFGVSSPPESMRDVECLWP